MRNVLVETLKVNGTVYNFKAMKKDAIDMNTYVAWVKAIEMARVPFGNYALAEKKAIKMGKDAVIDKDIKTKAYKALYAILAVIGEVNGHPVDANDFMLSAFAKHAIKAKKVKVGAYKDKAEELAKAKKDQKEIANGMTEEYIESVNNKVEELTIEANILKNLPESADKNWDIAKPDTFRKNLEQNIYEDVLKAQELMTAEEYEERRLKAKEEKKAQRKAERQAKAKANAQAK